MIKAKIMYRHSVAPISLGLASGEERGVAGSLARNSRVAGRSAGVRARRSHPQAPALLSCPAPC